MDGSPKFLQDDTSKSVEFIRGHSKQVHGITDTMVRGQPTIEHVLPQFIEFLGEPDTFLLAHNAPFDLGFLAMALTRLGIAYPPHYVFDTLDMARRLYPTWPSHLVERMASPLHGATGALHGRAHAGSSLHRDR
jgi:DNA polymerase III epsilon subunit-like protein